MCNSIEITDTRGKAYFVHCHDNAGKAARGFSTLNSSISEKEMSSYWSCADPVFVVVKTQKLFSSH